MNFLTQRLWLLAILLLIAMLLPIWIGRYFPSYDYPNHLLEAQIVVHYDDPQLGYADNYEINSGWYLRSNALSTLLLIGLGQMMPIYVAGHIVLSLYMLLFLGGLILLLRRQGTVWPLLLVAPVLAYNFALTSGWLNFCYGLALSLYILEVYLRWQKEARGYHLWVLVFLMLLIYMAHLMVWGLLLLIIAVMIALEPYRWRRHGLLWLALHSALPLLLLTRPLLAVLALLFGPTLWLAATWLRRYSPNYKIIIGAGLGLIGVILVIIKVLEPIYQELIPELDYSEFDKLTFPLRLFTLPHQFLPPNSLLISFNLILLVLILTLVGLLTWSTLAVSTRRPSSQPPPGEKGSSTSFPLVTTGKIEGGLLVISILGLLYLMIPSRTSDIWITEPRVLLFIALMGLLMVRLPPTTTRLYRAISLCTISLCLLSVIGTTIYAYNYEQKALTWRAQMAELKPADKVLTLRETMSPYISRPTLLGTFNRFYTGEFFSVIYALEQGGFASRTFNNGPVHPHQTMPIPAYDWPGFQEQLYIPEQCPHLRDAYDAILFWGNPNAKFETQLNNCFIAGPRWTGMAIWWNNRPLEEVGGYSN